MSVPNLSQMEEVLCPDCRKPLVIVPVERIANRYRFDGCRCAREEFELPDCIAAGFGDGPLFIYKPKSAPV